MILKIYPENPNPKAISQIISVLENDGVIIYPTDSVYGIGCDIHNHKAAARVAQIKGVKLEQANFSLIFNDMSQLSEYVRQLNNNTFKLMKHCLPGPFTFILNAGNKVPKIFTQKKKTIGIRIPDNNIIRAIVKSLEHPILTTSVKDDDEIVEYTTNPELIHERYEKLVDLVIDGGYGNNVGTTIVDCTGEKPVLIRKGIGNIDF